MVVLTRSAAKLKENQVEFKPSKPEETVGILSDQNLRAASKGHSAPSKGPSAPKKNAKSVNLLKTLVSEVQNEETTTDTKNKGEKQPASKVSSTIESPEAAAKQNVKPNPNMKPSQKKSTKKPRTKKCLFHPVQ